MRGGGLPRRTLQIGGIGGYPISSGGDRGPELFHKMGKAAQVLNVEPGSRLAFWFKPVPGGDTLHL
jgi:hypothetical protein